MAKLYFDKLSKLVENLNIAAVVAAPIEVKHFFSGAALYINETLCVSWSPVGLAFKLFEADTKKLINSGKAIPLKYFPKGHIKKGYALFESPDEIKLSHWLKYFKLSAKQV